MTKETPRQGGWLFVVWLLRWFTLETPVTAHTPVRVVWGCWIRHSKMFLVLLAFNTISCYLSVPVSVRKPVIHPVRRDYSGVQVIKPEEATWDAPSTCRGGPQGSGALCVGAGTLAGRSLAAGARGFFVVFSFFDSFEDESKANV